MQATRQQLSRCGARSTRGRPAAWRRVGRRGRAYGGGAYPLTEIMLTMFRLDKHRPIKPSDHARFRTCIPLRCSTCAGTRSPGRTPWPRAAWPASGPRGPGRPPVYGRRLLRRILPSMHCIGACCTHLDHVPPAPNGYGGRYTCHGVMRSWKSPQAHMRGDRTNNAVHGDTCGSLWHWFQRCNPSNGEHDTGAAYARSCSFCTWLAYRMMATSSGVLNCERATGRKQRRRWSGNSNVHTATAALGFT